MGRVHESQIPTTLEFMRTELPELLMALGRVEDKDEYWQEVDERCTELFNRTGKKTFNKLLILAIAEYLDITYQKRKNSNLKEVQVNWSIKV